MKSRSRIVIKIGPNSTRRGVFRDAAKRIVPVSCFIRASSLPGKRNMTEQVRRGVTVLDTRTERRVPSCAPASGVVLVPQNMSVLLLRNHIPAHVVLETSAVEWSFGRCEATGGIVGEPVHSAGWQPLFEQLSDRAACE